MVGIRQRKHILAPNRKMLKGVNGIIHVANKYILIKIRYYFIHERLERIKNKEKCPELVRMLGGICNHM